jgi:hypothetical protein
MLFKKAQYISLPKNFKAELILRHKSIKAANEDSSAAYFPVNRNTISQLVYPQPSGFRWRRSRWLYVLCHFYLPSCGK